MNRKIKIQCTDTLVGNESNEDDDHEQIQQWVQQTLDSAPDCLGYLHNKTEADIVSENQDILFRELEHCFSPSKPTCQSTYNAIGEMLAGLSGYRIVDDICELVRGRYIRWISRKNLHFKWKQYRERNGVRTDEQGCSEAKRAPPHTADGLRTPEPKSPNKGGDALSEAKPWYQAFKPGITTGGFLTNITMTDSGTKLTWRSRNRMGCILLDDCIVFQALTNEEKLYLSIQEL